MILNAARFSAFALAALPAFAQPFLAPPTAHPIIKGDPSARAAAAPPTAAAPSQYSVGDPTDEEQLYLELINRARLDPAGEARRFVNHPNEDVRLAMQFVDTNMMVAEISAYPVAQPLSLNPKLSTAARNHTAYMFNTGQQTHFGPNPGDDLGDRLQTVGYSFSTAGESVYSYAYAVDFGHAGFEVDWTGAPAQNGNGGMQTPRGHRDNNHFDGFVEVGIGVLNGSNEVPPNPPVGPQLVTQDFAAAFGTTRFITGVAYYDLNGNDFYDIGEGLGGVTVRADGVDAFAVTTHSGAYSIPVQPNRAYTVRITASGLAETTRTVNVAAKNVKVDFKPTFVTTAASVVPASVFVGVNNPIKIAALGGATAYRARVYTAQAAPVEGAESTSNVTLATSPGYTTPSTAFRFSGTRAFRLAHPDLDPRPEFGRSESQFLTLNTPFFIKSGAQVSFRSLLGIAHSDEVAQVEVSTDDGATWAAVYTQAGKYVPGSPVFEEIFNLRTVSLNAYVGKIVRFRFHFVSNGLFYPPSDNAIGWYIDDITLSNIDGAVNPTVTLLDSSATFPFNPAAAGNYLAQFQAVAGARNFPWGPAAPVTAIGNPPSLMMSKNVAVAGGNVTLKFTRTAGATVAFGIESAAAINGPWQREDAAVVTGPVGSEYTAVLAASGSARYYRALPK